MDGSRADSGAGSMPLRQPSASSCHTAFTAPRLCPPLLPPSLHLPPSSTLFHPPSFFLPFPSLPHSLPLHFPASLINYLFPKTKQPLALAQVSSRPTLVVHSPIIHRPEQTAAYLRLGRRGAPLARSRRSCRRAPGTRGGWFRERNPAPRAQVMIRRLIQK
jgi:hypothetical protein